jgi:hypothetical protein
MSQRQSFIRVCGSALFLFGLLCSTIVAQGQEGLEVQVNQAEGSFPDSIEFQLTASVPGPVASAELRYGVERVSCSQTTSRAVVELEEEAQQPGQISVDWTWELRRSGSVPPHARIWWQWHLTGEAGESWSTPVAWFTFEDDRYRWRIETQGDITVHWYSGGQAFAQQMLQAAVEAHKRLTAEPGARLEEPVHLYFYADAEALKSAMLFAQRWTGGVAFPDYYTILIAAGPEDQDYGRTTVAHEIMHLIVRQLAFNCSADLPRWLDEGLAVWAEGGMTEREQELLAEAIAQDELLSLRAISSSFSAHAGRAELAYAESYSVVAFLLEQYGREDILDLLAAFQAGASQDGALEQVYGWDTDALEDLWRSEIGAAPRPTPAVLQGSPTAVPTLELWSHAPPTPPPATATVLPTPLAVPASTETPQPTASPVPEGALAMATSRPPVRPTPIGGVAEPAEGAGCLVYVGGGAALAVLLLVVAGAVYRFRRRVAGAGPTHGGDQ